VPELPPEVENNTTVATGAVNGEIPGPVITPTTATPPEENYNDSWEGSGYDSKNNENETLTVTNAYTETPTEGGP